MELYGAARGVYGLVESTPTVTNTTPYIRMFFPAKVTGQFDPASCANVWNVSTS